MIVPTATVRASARTGVALLPVNYRELLAKRVGRKADGGAEAPAPQGRMEKSHRRAVSYAGHSRTPILRLIESVQFR